jgi:hypothetical protein
MYWWNNFDAGDDATNFQYNYSIGQDNDTINEYMIGGNRIAVVTGAKAA